MATQEAALDFNTQIITYESQSLEQSGKIRALKATNQESYQEVVTWGRLIATFIGEVENSFQPRIDDYRLPLDRLYQAKKSILDVAKGDKDYCAREQGGFEYRERQAQQEKERLARVEQQRQEDEIKLAAAVKAEDAGLKPEAVEQILTAPSRMAAPSVAPTYTKAAGTSVRETWRAEVESFVELVKAAAANPALLPYLMPNESALNQRAKAEKSAMSIPGVKAVVEAKAAYRGV
jgi:hypothetical protein